MTQQMWATFYILLNAASLPFRIFEYFVNFFIVGFGHVTSLGPVICDI